MESCAKLSPAEVYDEQFVPALFSPWATKVAGAAAIVPGDSVLDVACGTGVLALAASDLAGPTGNVTGLDINNEMLAVAKTKNSSVEWLLGRAESLPFPDADFDAVVSQFGLMFFEDRAAAVREMWRVLRPGGRLVVAVCDSVDHSPGYAVLAELLHRLFGEAVAQAFRAPFTCGDPEQLARLWTAAGIEHATVTRHDSPVQFPSASALVSTERACAWTLGGLLNSAQFERLLDAAEESLAPFAAVDGHIEFNVPALLVTARK